jgi:hypothetical protein
VTVEDLHRHLRAALGSWFRTRRFRRSTRTALGWYRAPVLVWIQIEPPAWDEYAGGRFSLNVERGPDEPWAGPTRRLPELLTDDELATSREIHNAVVAKCAPPPPDHLERLRSVFERGATGADAIIDAYLATFRPRVGPSDRHDDSALAYYDAADIAAWARLIRQALPRVIAEADADGTTAG